MPDKRSVLDWVLWDHIGPPLYYCEDCMLAVKVTPVEGAEPVLERPCTECKSQIIAPRSAIMPGEGGLNRVDRVRQGYRQLAAALTGRCV